ncbi:unnamed protein product [Owenia fusiformis]|uniref:Armadillo repeat protein deleted in velo-cardio-facial syndrome n=1 Tax=Owenia fusiformis TaxID=6347 RepID=A0A8S4P087_OWEFU|nr:unnamed protein product [Owenia fusiformis]
MPAGTTAHPTHENTLNYNFRQATKEPVIRNGDESAASILQSVKEQEAQFEQLTRELEAERQSVANQLERYASDNESMDSITETNESFRWRGQNGGAPTATSTTESYYDYGEEGVDLSNAGNNQLVDSCLRVLQERGLMGDDQQNDQYPDEGPPLPPPSSEHYRTATYSTRTMNGPNGTATQYERYGDVGPESPNMSYLSIQSDQPAEQQRVTKVTKVVTTRHITQSGDVPQNDQLDNYATYSSLRSSSQAEDPPPLRPAQGPPTPTRFTNNHDFTYNSHNYENYYPSLRENEYNRDPYIQQQETYTTNDDRYIPQPDDRYAPRMADDRYAPQVAEDSFVPNEDPYSFKKTTTTTTTILADQKYRDQSQYPEDPYSSQPNDSFSNPPDDRYPDDSRYGNPPSSAFRTQSPTEPRYGSQTDDRYGNPPTSAFRTQSPTEPRYGSQSDDRYGNPPTDVYGNGPDNRYPNDRYDGIDLDKYNRQQTPSPAGGSDRFGGPPGYTERADYNSLQRSPGGRPLYDDEPPRPAYPEGIPQVQEGLVGGPDFDPRRSPSVDSATREMRWRDPDLPEVIEFLSHPNDAIKSNAAAYLQHLTFHDDDVKAKTRSLGGIPVLVELLSHEIPEVHRNASGALRNLSYGKPNEENKKAINNAGGLPALVHLLMKSVDNDVRELVTGILWNMSSSPTLKKPIIDEALAPLVRHVLIPYSGWDQNMDPNQPPRDIHNWSTVFRNTTGILRNISSADEYARKKLRECEGLVDALLHIVKAAIGKNDIDNKSVENCVCVLRNLCYACQEVSDKKYLAKKAQAQQNDAENPGCFGGSKKNKKPANESKNQNSPQNSIPNVDPNQGMGLLWRPDVVHVYLPLLSDCSNPETLEAAAGAIQNLAACEWQPSIDIRAAVRKEKGLPIIVELLGLDNDRVVRAAATALRNLAIDTRNKELIGKYAMQQLVIKLPHPQENKSPEQLPSNETISAIIATLYEVIKKSSEFAMSIVEKEGVVRLHHIATSNKYTNKVNKFAATILNKLWEFKDLHPEYKKKNYSEKMFKVAVRPGSNKSPPVSANNTLHRPRADLGGGPYGAEYNDKTLPPINRQNPNHVMGRMDDMDPVANRMQDSRGPNPYGTRDEYEMNNRMRSQQSQPSNRDLQGKEPLYAQVDKRNKRQNQSPHSPSQRGMQIEGMPAEGGQGADSWV